MFAITEAIQSKCLKVNLAVDRVAMMTVCSCILGNHKWFNKGEKSEGDNCVEFLELFYMGEGVCPVHSSCLRSQTLKFAPPGQKLGM